MRHFAILLILAAWPTSPIAAAQGPNEAPPRHAGAPIVSPDGKTVLFGMDSAGHRLLYAMNPDGTNQRELKLDFAGMQPSNASWFDSRRLLVVLAANRSSPRHVALMNLDGGEAREISVDGSVIAAMSVGDGSTFVVATRGADPQGPPALRIARLDGSAQRAIELPTVPGRISAPRLSRDGKQLAFVAGIRDSADIAPTFLKSSTLYVMSVDGTNLRSVATFAGMVELPSWSYDGTRIALQHDHPYAHDARGAPQHPNELDDDVMIVDLVTGSTRELTHRDGPYLFETPDWSPDGHLFVQSNKAGVMEVYRVNADGSDVLRLTR